MKNLKTTITLILIIIAGLVAEPNFGAGKMANCNAGTHQTRRHNIMTELNLTADQQKKMDEMHLKFQKSDIDKHAVIQKKAIDKQQAMRNEDFATAKKLTTELFDLKAELANQRIEQHEEMSKILTAEQKAKFKELRDDRRGEMHKKGKMKRGFGKHGMMER